MTISFSNAFLKVHQPNFVNTRSFSTHKLKGHGFKIMELEQKKFEKNRSINEKNVSRFLHKTEKSRLETQINKLMQTKQEHESRMNGLDNDINTLQQDVAEIQLKQNAIIREHNMQLMGTGTKIISATDTQVKFE